MVLAITQSNMSEEMKMRMLRVVPLSGSLPDAPTKTPVPAASPMKASKKRKVEDEVDVTPTKKPKTPITVPSAPTCGLCHKEGHNKRTCPERVEESSSETSSNAEEKAAPKCGLCKKEGHNKRTCPERVDESDDDAVDDDEVTDCGDDDDNPEYDLERQTTYKEGLAKGYLQCVDGFIEVVHTDQDLHNEQKKTFFKQGCKKGHFAMMGGGGDKKKTRWILPHKVTFEEIMS